MTTSWLKQHHAPIDPIRIFVIPVDKAKGIAGLLDVVSTEGAHGIKTDSYWMVSTSTAFGSDGSPEVEFYNMIMQYANSRGFNYIQFTF